MLDFLRSERLRTWLGGEEQESVEKDCNRWMRTNIGGEGHLLVDTKTDGWQWTGMERRTVGLIDEGGQKSVEKNRNRSRRIGIGGRAHGKLISGEDLVR